MRSHVYGLLQSGPEARRYFWQPQDQLSVTEHFLPATGQALSHSTPFVIGSVTANPRSLYQ